MKIGIDARPTERPSSRNRGVGLYTRRLTDGLLARNVSLHRPHTFTIITSRSGNDWHSGASVRHVPAIRKPSRLQWILDRWTLPRTLEEERFDVFHATEFTSIPASSRTKVIAHVHDMIPFLFWNDYSHRIPFDYRCALKIAKRRLEETAYIVTVSQHSKHDIAELTGYPEERIFVAYEGPPIDVNDTDATRPEPSYSERPYFLYVGGTDFRKNVQFLIRAFARFTEREHDVRLVLVGETFMMTSLPEVGEILQEINRLGIGNRVGMIGYVDDLKLQQLYRGSLGLVFPSLYEGFGLPVLEAMTYGVPVVAAKTSSIPEVLGDTGIYFDPRNEDSLIAGLEKVYGDPTRCHDLVEKAKQRARLFSWNTVADVAFDIYDRISSRI